MLGEIVFKFVKIQKVSVNVGLINKNKWCINSQNQKKQTENFGNKACFVDI